MTFLEASRIAQEKGTMYVETSSLTGENVDDVFLKVARSVLQKIQDGKMDDGTMRKRDAAGEPLKDSGVVTPSPTSGCSC